MSKTFWNVVMYFLCVGWQLCDSPWAGSSSSKADDVEYFELLCSERNTHTPTQQHYIPFIVFSAFDLVCQSSSLSYNS